MRWWCRFIDKSGLPLLLFTKDELPLNKEAQERVETQLLLFVICLCRVSSPKPLLGSTIDGYVGHVKALHVRMTGGMAFQDVLTSSQRLKSLKRKVMSARPSTSRTKVAFEALHYVQFEAARRKDKRRWLEARDGPKAPPKKRKRSNPKKKPKTATAIARAEAAADVPFMLDRITMGVSVAMTGVLRSSEIVDNKLKAHANRAPIMLSDLHFWRMIRGVEVEIEVLAEGFPDGDAGYIDYATSRMPPSKSDPIQRVGNELIFPRKLERSDPDGAMENIVNFMIDYPIPKNMHSLTPLMRSRRQGAQRQIQRNEFINDFRRVCKIAGLQYSQWGTHAFRVGGMNALQDAGASVAEIMALGHWRSDAWMLYSRRNRPRLREWSKQILHVRQKGDFRSKAIKRVEGAGTDASGRYVCIGSGFAHGIEGDADEGVENDDDWD